MLFRRGLQIALRQRQGFRPTGAQAYHLDSETGIDIIQLAAEETADMRRIASGGRQFQALYRHHAIDPPQPDFQSTGAIALPLQLTHHVLRKIRQNLIEERAMADGFHQPPLHHGQFHRNHG